MKKILALIGMVSADFLAQPAIAGWINPERVFCYFFRGERLELQETCIHSSAWGTGQGEAHLEWPDGVVTKMSWNANQRNRQSIFWIDGYEALTYNRDTKTFERLKDKNQTENVMGCWQSVKTGNSVCWHK